MNVRGSTATPSSVQRTRASARSGLRSARRTIGWTSRENSACAIARTHPCLELETADRLVVHLDHERLDPTATPVHSSAQGQTSVAEKRRGGRRGIAICRALRSARAATRVRRGTVVRRPVPAHARRSNAHEPLSCPRSPPRTRLPSSVRESSSWEGTTATDRQRFPRPSRRNCARVSG